MPEHRKPEARTRRSLRQDEPDKLCSCIPAALQEWCQDCLCTHRLTRMRELLGRRRRCGGSLDLVLFLRFILRCWRARHLQSLWDGLRAPKRLGWWLSRLRGSSRRRRHFSLLHDRFVPFKEIAMISEQLLHDLYINALGDGSQDLLVAVFLTTLREAAFHRGQEGREGFGLGSRRLRSRFLRLCQRHLGHCHLSSRSLRNRRLRL
mmetsp:Transcript_98387/g.220289  ORF Transcript_98387/g.220289 Transcript_98387/m.220289 type:complete len:206 (+) Transcript_98387:990-1607(+)